MDFSEDLLGFLLDVDIVNDYKDKSTDQRFKEISYNTNAFSAKFYLQYNIRFDEDKIIFELKEILKYYHHLIGEDTAYGVIVMYALLKKTQRNKEGVLSFFKLIKPIRIKQYVFFRGRPEVKLSGLSFRDFKIGEIDYNKFSNFIANHTGSDYANLYKKEGDNSVGIEMKNRPIYALEVYKWIEIVWGNPTNISIEIQEMVNYYLQNLALSSFEELERQFDKQQQILNSLFGICFSLEDFKYFGFSFVNIFYAFSNDTSIGWVLPIRQGVDKIYFPDSKKLNTANTFISKEEKGIISGNNVFKRQLVIAIEYFSSAQKNIHTQKYNHAYIDYFVGLDFLLAPDTEKSKKLKQRIALLTHSVFKIEFLDFIKRMDELYDARSEYIHNGKSVDTSLLIEIRNISRIVICILIRLNAKTKSNDNEIYEKWIKQIDDSVQDLYKGIDISKACFLKIGINQADNVYLTYDLK